MSTAVVGTSGWGYPSWQPGFYPAGINRSEFLAYYAAQLATVELNATKYRLPSEDQFRTWAALARPRSAANSSERPTNTGLDRRLAMPPMIDDRRHAPPRSRRGVTTGLTPQMGRSEEMRIGVHRREGG